MSKVDRAALDISLDDPMSYYQPSEIVRSKTKAAKAILRATRIWCHDRARLRQIMYRRKVLAEHHGISLRSTRWALPSKGTVQAGVAKLGRRDGLKNR